MAALINVVIRDLYCGASIISNRYAITVAHCVRPAAETALLVGDHDISTGKTVMFLLTFFLHAMVVGSLFSSFICSQNYIHIYISLIGKSY